MIPLPVIVGFGGINPAGRLSFNHAYRRLVIDALSKDKQARTYRSLTQLMNLDDSADGSAAASAQTRQYVRDHTLIRRIEGFDPEQINWQTHATLASGADTPLSFVISKRQLPDTIPEHWQVKNLDDKQVHVTSNKPLEVLLPQLRASRVTSAGQLPSGFEPGSLYASRNHPRALQITVYGASDAIRSSGFSPAQLKDMVAPDQIAVYSGSAMGQLDQESYGGLLQNPLTGKRPTSKQTALGLPEMAGDFVNAYVLGSVGETAGIIGACATFLYNVKRAMDDIRSGQKRIVIVGNAEAPITPYVIEGYRTMGALAEDEALMALDGSDTVDNRRACRPFSDNAGFTVAESSTWLVLMDDKLAIEQGAQILAAVGDVFVNADGYKKSVSGPGIGNYVTVAKAMAAARAMLGEKTLRHGTYMQAHGTGTPQNRVTESHIFDSLASTFGINDWLVSAVKSYLGHSMAPAGGDQLSAILGAWQDAIVPGITSIDHIADDVHHSNLNLSMQHTNIDPLAFPGAFVNSKGFGGNNATGLFLSPAHTRHMLERRWGRKQVAHHAAQNEAVLQRAEAYNNNADDGSILPIYQFGEGVLEGSDLGLSDSEMRIPGFAEPIVLSTANPYQDMTD
ncbi:MAG: beta-ketoacyl synthase [Pseudomonadaceae bacterium]|nr:beta-ketoacyl synthase [Pseudomonadaceae bacterium]